MGEVVEHPSSGVQPPEHLTAEHDLSAFDCGAPELNTWLRERALKNEASRDSRTYVVCAGKRVIGFYCLANGGLMRAVATKKAGRQAPDPVPVMILGRMGVDIAHQGQGIGRDMLQDAILRTAAAGEHGGIRILLVHAKSERAKKFYQDAGFDPSPIAPMTLMLRLVDAERVLRQPD